MGRLRNIQRRASGLAIGAAVTVLGAAALAVGLFDRLDNYGLDLHFQHLSTIEADPRIVLIDINDHALRAVGDWPWPRRRYAQVVRTLSKLGADVIVLDLVLSEPATPRTEHASLGPHYDVDTELPVLGDPSADPIIYDDDELRDAIADAGNVYLAMFFRLSPPGVDPQAVATKAIDLVRHDPGVSNGRFNSRLRAAFPGTGEVVLRDGLYGRARIAALLEEDFSLDAFVIASRLGTDAPVDLQTVEEHLPRIKRFVARQAARRYLTDHPGGAFQDFFELMLPDIDPQAQTPDRQDLIQAYRFQGAFGALAETSPMVPAKLVGRIAHATDLTIPVDKLARAARGIGFVSFVRERSGGVVREIPLLANAYGILIAQLGMLVATDVLGITRSPIKFDGKRLTLGRRAQQRTLPLDKNGLTLLTWHVPPVPSRWQESFDHIPVTRVLEIPLNAEGIAQNHRRLGLALAELVKLRFAETPAEYAEYVGLVNRRLAPRKDAPRDSRREYDVTSPLAGGMVPLDGRIREIEEDAVVWLSRVHDLWEETQPADDQERAERDKINKLYAKLGEGRLATLISKVNDRMTARNDTLAKELRPRIEGKICLVGYTASGVADLVTSPVYDSMPGVMAHANIINTLLNDRPTIRAPAWLNVIIVLLAGIAITIITCARGPVVSGVFLVVVVSALLLSGALAFRSESYHLASLPAAAYSCVVWACVTAYRQFTEERVRRQFQRALSQYTSPAVASRIASSASVDDLAPVPARVTCFFSDLQGFTRLSERLGAERTRFVLNTYLRTMSRVLVDHRAIINKFMGDGIFAFFNAPIWPCADHCEAACACALASLGALRELNREGAIAAADGPLVMRIGISTGEAFVGDYGSDTKLDYTCIGDTVNVGARLEEANKAFGTAVLVDDACRCAAGERFVFRTLGRIAVAGKSRPVALHQLVEFTDRIQDAERDYIAAFEEAVRHYQAREWDPCSALLEKCGELRPDDRAVQLYREGVAMHRDEPPRQDWDRAVPLRFQ